MGTRAAPIRSCEKRPEQGLRLVLEHARRRASHHLAMALFGDFGRAAHQRELVRTLLQPELVQHARGIDDGARVTDAPARSAAKVVDRAQQRSRRSSVRDRARSRACRGSRAGSEAWRSSSPIGYASSAPNSDTAPSTPARGPSQTSRSGSRGRTNSTKRGSGSLRSTATLSGSSKPVRKWKSECCRHSCSTSLLRSANGAEKSTMAPGRRPAERARDEP